MDINELHKEMNMEYDELAAYLQQKYNKPARAFFCNSECKSEAKDIKRAKEGLYIHHIKEIEVDNLQKKEQAKANPWEYQEPQNLCYCNYLEHLLLHIKCNKIRCARENRFVIDGVLNHIVPELNHIYTENPVYSGTQEWRNAVKALIIDNYAEYQEILSKWIEDVKSYVLGERLSLNKVLQWKGFSKGKSDYEKAMEYFRFFS